ncbi:hypothetical protein CRUP_019403 [Coryphaenoides rupestris]|nr:hypothetical protein CRUP_019403 [Coryphaenoides rupestris]
MHGAGVSQQDPSSQGAAAGERGELVHTTPRDLPGSPDTSELGSPRSAPPRFDLLKMVVSYKRMTLFLEPATDAVELTRFLLGWRMPVCSMLVCIVLNFFFLTLSEVGWFLVSALAVSTPAALGYLQDRCGGNTSEAELQKKRCHAVHRRDLQMVHLTKQEAMLEVKDLLKQLDDWLMSACLTAESLYKVLYWDSHLESSRFYGGVLFVTCLLYTVPVGWVLAGLTNALFLWNRDFCRVLLQPPWTPEQEQTSEQEADRAEQDQGSLQDRTPTPTSLEDLSPGSVEEAEEAEPDDEFKDAIEVSKLTEKLRKRYPTTSTGNCSSCSAVFSVLKKRRSCSNCGNSFCSRCCSFKVLRSSMGATAPEAQRETVCVCAPCNSSLNKFL